MNLSEHCAVDRVPGVASPPRDASTPAPVILWALLLATVIALYSLRGASATEITYNDEARHAMNGAALYDMAHDGAIGRPVQYLYNYFGHFPALSMPYHPPLFPAIEALFFAVLGVHVYSARLAVAFFVFGSVALLYLLVFRTHRSASLATAVVIAFFSLPTAQAVAADIMLEMPALFFILASLHFMIGLERGWTVRSASAAALLAVAGVWTKQTVYLGLIPPFAAVLAGYWRFWRSLSSYVFLAIFGAGCLAYAGLAAKAGLGFASKGWADVSLVPRLIRNVAFYTQSFGKQLGFGALLIAAAVALLALSGKWKPLKLRSYFHPLYLAWAAAVLFVLAVVSAFDARYLLFGYPPILVLLFYLAYGVIQNTAGARIAEVSVLGLGLAIALHNGLTPATVLKGPGIAAREVYRSGGRRVLFAGVTNGGYIFATRELDTAKSSRVMRADKLPPEAFDTDAFEALARRYGIDFVVLEKKPGDWPWNRLIERPSMSMELESRVPVTGDAWLTGCTLYLYRFKNPSPSDLLLPFPVTSTGETAGGSHVK